MLSRIQKQLQIDTPLALELYSLNVYQKDGHFVKHKDTPRGPDMIGTVVVNLPGAYYEGGAMTIAAGDRSTEVFRGAKVEYGCSGPPSVGPDMSCHMIIIHNNDNYLRIGESDLRPYIIMKMCLCTVKMDVRAMIGHKLETTVPKKPDPNPRPWFSSKSKLEIEAEQKWGKPEREKRIDIAAFFSDIDHEIHKVTDGTRMTVAFLLKRADGLDGTTLLPKVLDLQGQEAKLAERLEVLVKVGSGTFMMKGCSYHGIILSYPSRPVGFWMGCDRGSYNK